MDIKYEKNETIPQRADGNPGKKPLKFLLMLSIQKHNALCAMDCILETYCFLAQI